MENVNNRAGVNCRAPFGWILKTFPGLKCETQKQTPYGSGSRYIPLLEEMIQLSLTFIFLLTGLTGCHLPPNRQGARIETCKLPVVAKLFKLLKNFDANPISISWCRGLRGSCSFLGNEKKITSKGWKWWVFSTRFWWCLLHGDLNLACGVRTCVACESQCQHDTKSCMLSKLRLWIAPMRENLKTWKTDSN